MLAKLRAESGTSSRSDDVMTVLMVLLVVSIGWLASEGPRSRTSTDTRTDCGWSVTTSTGWRLTATTNAAGFSANTVKFTVNVQLAGCSDQHSFSTWTECMT